MGRGYTGFEQWLEQLPELPEIEPRKSIGVNREDLAHCLTLVEQGTPFPKARQTVGISHDTWRRYRQRARDVKDPYHEVLGVFIELIEEARTDGVAIRAQNDEEELGWAEPADISEDGLEVVKEIERIPQPHGGYKQVTRERPCSRGRSKHGQSESPEREDKAVKILTSIGAGIERMKRRALLQMIADMEKKRLGGWTTMELEGHGQWTLPLTYFCAEAEVE